MSNLIFSICVAVFSVGSVFYVSYQEVQADYEAQLADTIALLEDSDTIAGVIANELTIGEGALFTPLWEREVYVHITPDEVVPQVFASEEKSTLSADESTAVIDVPVVAMPEPEKDVITDPVELPETTEKNLAPLSVLERELIRLINLERAQRDLGGLILDDALSEVASSHSAHMAEEGFFAHADQSGCALTCRLQMHDYKALAWAENLVFVEKSDLISEQDAAEYIVESWMESGPHRENILHETYTHTGIGIAYDGTTLYATADYALRK